VDDQTILADDPNFGNVTICPGGVVHINLPYCGLKFVPADFERFAELIGQARLKMIDIRGASDGKPRLQLVSSKTEDHPPSEPVE